MELKLAVFHFRRLLRAALFSPLYVCAWACVRLPVSASAAVSFMMALAGILWAVDGFLFRRGGRS